MQVAAYRFYCYLLPEKRVSQIDFVRSSIVHQYVRFDRTARKINVSLPNLVSRYTNVRFLENPIPKGSASIARRTAENNCS